jgi:butyryl-CoA dehydrogenase
MLFCSQRVQFGKPICKYQGVGFVNADLFAKLMAATCLALNLAGFFDQNIMGKKPSKDDEKTAANQAAQAKYLIARMTHEISYEVQNAMGGMALTDNLQVDRTLEVSKVEEVIGGTRNVMLMLMDGAIQRMVSGLVKEQPNMK